MPISSALSQSKVPGIRNLSFFLANGRSQRGVVASLASQRDEGLLAPPQKRWLLKSDYRVGGRTQSCYVAPFSGRHLLVHECLPENGRYIRADSGPSHFTAGPTFPDCIQKNVLVFGFLGKILVPLGDFDHKIARAIG